MKKPYVKKVGNVGKLKVYVVDGKYIRDNLNEEFTNCGEHYSYHFIPKDELWLDREHGEKDEKYYVDYLLTEYSLMSKGISYDKAWKQGNIVQKLERQKEKSYKKLLRLKEKQNYWVLEKIHKKLLKKYSNYLKVWIINGKIVRDLYFIDYVEGGHDKVYSFIPEGEIWIDEDVSKKRIKVYSSS
ncbi:hypothetical protein COU58_00070 [Candidatus Pacearchaeota archaeon CG10_big_fil_rev_8_21_14_0_10_32_42]|nr:MAG: hypothetical protein COU58_00070 [Candidatus Pacearchaeota archaeon CG10_big_fil_rev_8_21_14_0_10_32_42]